MRGWEGPHTLISVEGETAIIKTPAGRLNLWSACIKPFVDLKLSNYDYIHILTDAMHKQPADATTETKHWKSLRTRRTKTSGKRRKIDSKGLWQTVRLYQPVEKTNHRKTNIWLPFHRRSQTRRGQHTTWKPPFAQNYHFHDSTTLATKRPSVRRSSN